MATCTRHPGEVLPGCIYCRTRTEPPAAPGCTAAAPAPVVSVALGLFAARWVSEAEVIAILDRSITAARLIDLAAAGRLSKDGLYRLAAWKVNGPQR